MDGLTQLLPTIISGTSAGAGTIGNILEERKRAEYQNFVMDILRNPAKLAAMVAKLQKPMDNALVQGTTNRVQGDLAQRGLSQAPGIFAASEAQALAPYEQQNYNTALDAVMRSLGLPAGTFGQPANTSGAMQMFLNSLGKLKTGSGGGSTPGFTFPTDTVGDLGGYTGLTAPTGDVSGMTPQV